MRQKPHANEPDGFRFIGGFVFIVARGFPDAPHDGSFVFLRVKDDARYDLLYENCPTNRNLATI